MAARIRLFALIGLVASGCDWSQFRADPTHRGTQSLETAINPGNVATLTTRWDASIAVSGTLNNGFSSAAVVKGITYIGSENGDVYAFDAVGPSCTGLSPCAPLWTAPTNDAVTSSPAVANGVVYISSHDGNLYAFDATGVTRCSGTPTTCAPLWTAGAGPAVFSSPAVSANVVYIGSEDGNLYAFDATGVTRCSGTPKVCTPLWTGRTTAGVFSSPTVANGLVYVASTDSHIYAFGLPTQGSS